MQRFLFPAPDITDSFTSAFFFFLDSHGEKEHDQKNKIKNV